MKNTSAAGGPRDKKIESHLDNANDADNQDLRLLFDERPENDDPLRGSQSTGERKFSVINFLRSKLDRLSNWFQSARNYVSNLFAGSANSRALSHIRSNPASIAENKNSKLLINSQNFSNVPESYSENDNPHIYHEISVITENISSKEDFSKDFNQFKLMLQKYKSNEISSIDNFRTENAKHFGTVLLADADEKIKNDTNYFFKNISEYKDVAVASILLGKANKFEPRPPTTDQERNFNLWVISKKPEKVSELMSGGFKVDLEKAKIYADWIVFKNAIGELPDSVDESVIANATDLKGMMDNAEADGKIKSLNQSVNKIDEEMLDFFAESKAEKDKLLTVKSDGVKVDSKLPGFPKLNKENINLLWGSIAPQMSFKEFNALLIKSGLFFDGLKNPDCEVDFLLESGSYALTFANLWSKALNDPKQLKIFQNQEFFSHLKYLLEVGKIDAILTRLTDSNSRSAIQEPVAVIASEGLPDKPRNSDISSSPPPPPPPRLKATGDPATTNADVLTDIKQSAPPPAPPPRVRKNSEEIQQKPKEAVITLQPVADSEAEPNNLSLPQCVDVFKNLSRKDQADLGQLLAPDMTSFDFRSLFNQSSLFFTDLINGRPINPTRQDEVNKLSNLWDSAKKQSQIKDGLSQLRFYPELDYLLTMFKR